MRAGSRALALALTLLAAAGPACARDLTMKLPDFPYEDQGAFVQFPAKFVSSPVTQAGYMVGEVLCLPISLIQGQDEHDKEASLVCGKALGTGLGWPVYAAVGLPFFLLKAGFWDAPKALAGAFKKKS